MLKIKWTDRKAND